MCGIIGGWISSGSAPRADAFEAALSLLSHRGPDDRGLECAGDAGGQLLLGHTRLSIIDLSAAGHQPMRSACGRFAIVFNGEIYNYRELRSELATLGHRFVSDSDTEVLLASWATWGRDCLPRLRGMFAMAVHDRSSRTLTCVRDAFGIKPFYYRAENGAFLFASEVPALAAVMATEPQLNLQRAYDYLVFGAYDDGAETFLAGVRQLPPGHLLTVHLPAAEAPVMERWWWPSIAERTDLSFGEAAERLRGMFLDNIRLHLRSDVPTGAALSGGLDSSAVVSAIRHVEPGLPIRTFSYVARGSDVDEEPWADLVNGHVGAEAHKVLVAPEELANDLDDMIRAQGEPFGSTSIYAQYRVFKLAREHGVTVTLDGQGADELLAGYSGYPGPVMRSLIERRQPGAAVRFMHEWSQWPGRSAGGGLKSLLNVFVPDALRGVALTLAVANPTPPWLDADVLQEQGVTVGWRVGRDEPGDARGRRLVAALRRALSGQGLNALLRHGDRNSMRWSVESRVPFLTNDMAEFLLSLPEHYLVSRQGETKHIFRAAMRGIVPDEILNRKDKVGFGTPERAWLAQLGHRLDDWLAAAEQLRFLNAAACRAEVRAVAEGRKPFDSRAWRLINFCRWAQLTKIA